MGLELVGMAVHLFWGCEGLRRRITWQCPIQASEACSSISLLPHLKPVFHIHETVVSLTPHCVHADSNGWEARDPFFFPENSTTMFTWEWRNHEWLLMSCVLWAPGGPGSQWSYLGKTQNAILRVISTSKKWQFWLSVVESSAYRLRGPGFSALHWKTEGGMVQRLCV